MLPFQCAFLILTTLIPFIPSDRMQYKSLSSFPSTLELWALRYIITLLFGYIFSIRIFTVFRIIRTSPSSLIKCPSLFRKFLSWIRLFSFSAYIKSSDGKPPTWITFLTAASISTTWPGISFSTIRNTKTISRMKFLATISTSWLGIIRYTFLPPACFVVIMFTR